MKCPLFLDIKLLRGRILIFEDVPGVDLLYIIFASQIRFMNQGSEPELLSFIFLY